MGHLRTSTPSQPGWSNSRTKRLFDILSAICLFLPLCPLMLAIAVIIRFTLRGGAIYWSDRVGKNNVIFKMPKFRTMRAGTPVVASHLLENPGHWLTPIGRILRRLSLDELPQLYSVLKGDMSFVGPRPALFNQHDLIALRTRKGIHRLLPGITGWAQINGRDDLPIPIKVECDEYYLRHQSLALDLRILGLTLLRVLRRHGISH